MAQAPKNASNREERLRAQLRANLARRKQQARARREGEGDARDEGIEAAKQDVDKATPIKRDID
ncbi:MAG: hypothetical protein AAFP99_00160 [Pseudomonadota bacterium]